MDSIDQATSILQTDGHTFPQTSKGSHNVMLQGAKLAAPILIHQLWCLLYNASTPFIDNQLFDSTTIFYSHEGHTQTIDAAIFAQEHVNPKLENSIAKLTTVWKSIFFLLLEQSVQVIIQKKAQEKIQAVALLIAYTEKESMTFKNSPILRTVVYERVKKMMQITKKQKTNITH